MRSRDCQALKRVRALLRRAYGPRPWKCWGDGVSVLVDTILSQNTSAANSDAGYRQLRRRFRSWKQVAEAPVEEVERHIRVSGLSNQKAPRIQAILRQIRSERGKIDLQFLSDLDAQAAYDYLRNFPGVGPKTACCTLLFAFGKAVFPVDTHIHRIARRLGLVAAKATAEQTHEVLTPLIGPEDRYEMHVLAHRARAQDLPRDQSGVRGVRAARPVPFRQAAGERRRLTVRRRPEYATPKLTAAPSERVNPWRLPQTSVASCSRCPRPSKARTWVTPTFG